MQQFIARSGGLSSRHIKAIHLFVPLPSSI